MNDLKRPTVARRLPPDVSLDQHIKLRRLQLGVSCLNKVRIYLDTCYWLRLRDQRLRRINDPAILSLHTALGDLVRRGSCICPIEANVFLEVMKQTDRTTRRLTAELIDELSLGTTMVPEHERLAQELVTSISATDCSNDLHHPSQLIWSKIGFVLGDMLPTDTPFSAEDELTVQKMFYDHVCGLGFVDVIDTVGDNLPPGLWSTEFANRLTADYHAHAGEIDSFSRLWWSEFLGGLRTTTEVVASALEANQLDEGRVGAWFSEVEKVAKPNATTMRRMAEAIPTLHVGALLHAAIRWDKSRSISPNDLYDLGHAKAAIPYCSVFLTERPLKTMLLQNHLRIADSFDCVVLSEIDEAQKAIEIMLAEHAHQRGQQ